MDIPMSYKRTPPLDEDTIALLYGKDTSYTAGQHPTPQVIASTKQKRVPILTGVLPTVLVVFLSAGLAIFLLAWLRIHQAQGLPGYDPGFLAAIRNGTFIVDEGYKENGEVVQASLRALTFSSVASHMIGLTSSFLMTLVAYRTASQWLANSERPSETAQGQNPTPVQYGLLLGLLGTSNVMSVWKAIRYTLRNKKQRSKLPSMFVEPLIIASIVLVLNHSLGVSDLWLHTTARSAIITVSIPGGVQDPSALKLGVAFNESLCDPSVPGAPVVSQPCLEFAHGWAVGSWTWILPHAWLVLYNSTSAPVRVITLADQNNTAVMVPNGVQSLNSRTSMSNAFKAPTLAVRSDCKIVTSACAKDQNNYVADCSPAGVPYLPLKWDWTHTSPPACNFTICFPNRIFGVIDGQTGTFVDTTYQHFPQNVTFPTGAVTLGLQLQLNQDNVIYLEPPDWVVDVKSRIYATCQVDFLQGSLNYDPSENQYSLTDEAHLPPNLTATLWGPLVSQYATNRLIADITGFIMGDPSVDPTLLLNANLPRVALGMLGGVVETVSATEASLVRQGVFGLYPVAPVLCVSGILYVYALFAMFIFFTSVSSKSYTVSTTASPKEDGMERYPPSGRRWNSSEGREKTALVLGQMWLTDPLPLVASVFTGKDGKDPQRSVAEDPLDMVLDTDGKAGRLVMGVTAVGDDTRFGLKRRERNFRGSVETL
ncbi:hypothetical protein FRB90_012803 [Tulasnella sp. 427]|nr:hypothetical protein FRB90_012803 [Tulasnella sp. 427]